MKVKNKSLVLDILFVVTFLILLRLGFWQLDRADQKNEINQNYLERQSSLEVFDETDIYEENLWGRFSVEGEFTSMRSNLRALGSTRGSVV